MNHFSRFILSLLLACAFIAPALALQQDDFCQSLSQVIAASKNGFKDIKTGDGQQQADFFGKVTVYQTTLKLPGAVSATINKGMKLVYHAVMAEDNSKSETINNAYYSLRENLKSCLGGSYKYTEVPGDINNVVMFKAQSNTNTQNDMYQPVVSVRYGKMDNDYKVVLEVEEPFFLQK
jgi:predicted outer membrane lipoprotein